MLQDIQRSLYSRSAITLLYKKTTILKTTQLLTLKDEALTLCSQSSLN